MKSNSNVHKVSKTVWVRRKKLPGNLPGDEEIGKIRKIGSSLAEGGTLRGLSFEEELLYLPQLISTSPKSDTWEEKTKEYWDNISRAVDTGEGLRLEVGFTYKTVKGLEYNACGDREIYKEDVGEPIKLSDYILWRYCLVYGRVANSFNDIEKSPKIWFYLFSKEEQTKSEKTALNRRRKAKKAYLNAAGNPELMRTVLWQFNLPVNTLSVDEIEIEFEKLSEQKPHEFCTMLEDKDLPTKAFIEEAISHGHLRRIQNTETIYYGDTQLIGNNMNEAVMFFSSNRSESVRVKNELEVKVQYQNVGTIQAKIPVREKEVKDSIKDKDKDNNTDKKTETTKKVEEVKA